MGALSRVGHGQPDEWDIEFPTETEQELRFREDILKLFADNGYKLENLSLAWMEFKQPEPTEKVEELAKNGVEKILYFSAAISADSIHSQSDVPDLVNAAKVPAGLPLINLGAWNDHPTVIQAIREKSSRYCPLKPKRQRGDVMDLGIAIAAAVLGYLLGCISFARIITRFVAPQQDVTQTEMPIPGMEESIGCAQ